MGCDHSHEACGCCSSLGRRDFLTTVGASALALQAGLLPFASSALADSGAPKGKPKLRAVFLRPDVKEYWMGWPGASYDIAARQADYARVLTDAAKSLDVDLQIDMAPITDKEGIDRLVAECKDSPPDGVILTVMSLNTAWPQVNRFCTEKPAELPTIVFSPMGTSFTAHLQPTRTAPRTYVAATQDYQWLASGVRLIRTIWDMRQTRLLIVNGTKTEDKPLAVIGTTLHYIPLTRWTDEAAKVEMSDEVKAFAGRLRKASKDIKEPNEQDVLNAAKNYFIAKRLMAAENCQGISLNCLGLMGTRKIPCTPCMAWLALNDEGSVGCCECDWNAAISLLLTSKLCGRPGFMQDPAPNTVNNTLMGAHCSSPTKLRGFDQPGEPLVLRSHSESALGVSPQVIWPLGEAVTVMKFDTPEKMILGTGKVVANIDTPPSGGCRTSVELAMDGVADARDCKGFHQLFVLGKLDGLYKAYCQLAGVEVVPIGATA